MNKYSESVINHFTDKKNVDKLFSKIANTFIAEYGPQHVNDIEALLSSENRRTQLIQNFLHRQKFDLMFVGVTNPRVQDQVDYLNVQFVSEHLPFFADIVRKASNGWNGIEPQPSQQFNDGYSVSGRSLVSDASREVVCDSNTHISKYVNGQTDNAPWKTPADISRESANKTLESWRYNTRPRIMRDDRVGTINLRPDSYGGVEESIYKTNVIYNPQTQNMVPHDQYSNVGYARGQPKGLDRGFASNLIPFGKSDPQGVHDFRNGNSGIPPQLMPQLQNNTTNQKKSGPQGTHDFPRTERFSGNNPVSEQALSGQVLADGSLRFNSCSADVGEEANQQFTDYIGPGTNNGYAVGNKWVFRADVSQNQNRFSQDLRFATPDTNYGREKGSVRSTAYCNNIDNTGVNFQSNMNTAGRPFNAVGNVEYGGETFDGVDLEPGTTYKRNDIPHLPAESQQHYRQLLDAPLVHILNSGNTPDLDPFVGKFRRANYRPETPTLSANNNYHQPTNEYPIQPKLNVPPTTTFLSSKKEAQNLNNMGVSCQPEKRYEGTSMFNSNIASPRNGGLNYTGMSGKLSPELRGHINTRSANLPVDDVAPMAGRTNIPSKNTSPARNKFYDGLLNKISGRGIPNSSDVNDGVGASAPNPLFSLKIGNQSINLVNSKNSGKKENYAGQRPSSLIVDPKTCSFDNVPGGIYGGGGLNGYKSDCKTYNTNAHQDLSGDNSSGLEMPNPILPASEKRANKQDRARKCDFTPKTTMPNSEQFNESNRPRMWNDGYGFTDQADPESMKRLLQRRNFRVFGDVATRKYIDQTDPSVDLGIFWSGEIYNDQIPFWQRALHQRRYDYDAEEAVGGFEMGNLQRGYDMSSLYCRVDNARKDYGRFTHYKKW